ncbi:putative sugar kinase [Pedobacter sp. BAL39]|uniref:NAD(P)H-hydrate dehydratase n=1 Tax=Pedobacter sp. BAL39 TaxID=391596 RepID=UPI000155B066|nr:NAD(P)H-hydrate dehydratase [Pedobacter sp. BAL39]EDM34373.1 putative sugar kinase [Pedobacter sp. BAL39]
MAIYLNTFLPDGNAAEPSELVSEGLTKSEGAHFSPYQLVTAAAIRSAFRLRVPFTHKGTYGHALIVAGAINTMGAAILSNAACMYGGVGLSTACIPDTGLAALNTAFPEVMFLSRADFHVQQEFDQYKAIAVGPGLGKSDDALGIVKQLLDLKRSLVIDADGLQLLAGSEELMQLVPEGSILTPHVKEFDRLFGEHSSWKARLDTGLKEAKRFKIIIVLKNEFTFIIDPQGQVLINPTGNPAMAQGGMGDVLTGLITAYVAQGYDARDAAMLACYFHGLAGDELAESMFNVNALQLAAQVPKSIKKMISVKS